MTTENKKGNVTRKKTNNIKYRTLKKENIIEIIDFFKHERNKKMMKKELF